MGVQRAHTLNCQHTWHRRLGHRDVEAIRTVHRSGAAEGMKLVDCGVRTVCRCCLEGKMSRTPFPKIADRGSKEILDVVHTDVSGPLTATPSGNQYFLTFIDDFSRMAFVYLLRRKSEVAEKVKDFVLFCKTQIGKTPRVLQSDNGGEYIAKELQGFLRSEGIISQFTAPYSPQQNGVAERRNRYLKEMTMCMLLDAGLDAKYWGEAVLTATYLQNRLPSRSIGMSPFERWYGRKPSFEHLKVFGSEAWVQIPAERRKKMEVKARKMVFVGYCNQQKAYRFLDKDSGRITISRDVRFVEDLEFGSVRATASEAPPPAGKLTKEAEKNRDTEDSMGSLPKMDRIPDIEEVEDFRDTSEVFSSGEEGGADVELGAGA